MLTHCAQFVKELHGEPATGVGFGVGAGVGFGVGAGVGLGVGAVVGQVVPVATFVTAVQTSPPSWQADPQNRQGRCVRTMLTHCTQLT
jgi:hypothetical protein